MKGLGTATWAALQKTAFHKLHSPGTWLFPATNVKTANMSWFQSDVCHTPCDTPPRPPHSGWKFSFHQPLAVLAAPGSLVNAQSYYCFRLERELPCPPWSICTPREQPTFSVSLCPYLTFQTPLQRSAPAPELPPGWTALQVNCSLCFLYSSHMLWLQEKCSEHLLNTNLISELLPQKALFSGMTILCKRITKYLKDGEVEWWILDL